MTELRQNEKLDFIYLEIYRCYCYGTKLLVTFSLNGTALRKKVRLLSIARFCHRLKYRNFAKFAGVEILWKGTVFAQFRTIRPKLCGNCALPQNFHTRKLNYGILCGTRYSLEFLV